jgi:L-ascorbate metabolism protein UlaG (beta-lactamase superfamily)
MADVTVTWLGHGTFLITSAQGKRILVDPWIDGNPAFPQDQKDQATQNIDVIALTHGHFDHVGDLLGVAQSTNAQIVCIFDMVAWLTKQGVEQDRFVGFNIGGTVEAAGVKFTMTHAQHSSSNTDENGNIVYLGQPVGYVMEFEDGTVIYHSGDTGVFGDMRIIGELYAPDAAILPIGDHFTMGPHQAAYAAKLIGAKRVIPEHYGTFPLLRGTPGALREALAGQDIEVVALEPGQSTTVKKTASSSDRLGA